VDPAIDDLFERQWFMYAFDQVVPAQAIQRPGNLQILSDADFEWWFNKVKYIPGPGTAFIKILMKENATGRDFVGTTASAQSGLPGTFNGVDIDLWGGQANLTGSFPLAVPYIMPATRVYTIFLTDYSPAPGTASTVQIVFDGFKLWPRPKIGDTTGIQHPGGGGAHPAGTSGYPGWGD
jgi:hypothetical protein